MMQYSSNIWEAELTVQLTNYEIYKIDSKLFQIVIKTKNKKQENSFVYVFANCKENMGVLFYIC